MRADRGIPWARAGVFLFALLVVVAVAVADGGYFRETWAWIVSAFSCAAGIALLLRERIVLSRLELLAVGALAAFIVWTAFSGVWSLEPTASLHEAERGLVYLAALLAVLLLIERNDVHALLGGLAAGIAIVATYGLCTRLLPNDPIERDAVSGTRLIEPLGYANALGILAVIGILLLLGFAAYGSTRLERALGAAASMLLLAALVLTESRGAWVALVLGLACWAFFEIRRARLLATAFVLTIPALPAAWLTERSPVFTDEGAALAGSSGSARLLAFELALAAIAAGLATLLVPLVENRLARQLRWAVRVLPALALVAVTLGAILGTDRSLEARTDYWRVAWGQFEDNILLGAGAGTFVHFWQRSGIAAGVRDAHSLYLETLAELGPLGVVLLLVAFALPFVAAVKARAAHWVPVAAGAYVAYLVHAGLDWDWEMPAVTLTALFCASALLVSARPSEPSLPIGARGRVGLGLAALSVSGLAAAARLLSG